MSSPTSGFLRTLLQGDPLDAARALLGARLVREDASGRRVGRIVEVEAYGGTDDRASHARMGRTPRNAVMFGPPGVSYVYLVYGMHHCLNVVTGPDGLASAVLVRAVEPLEGIELMRADRQASRGARSPRPGPALTRTPVALARLASGPGLVGACFGLDRSWNGLDLCDPAGTLRLERASGAGAGDVAVEVVTTPRVGVAYAGEAWASLPWRLFLAGSPSVSRPAPRRKAPPAPREAKA